MTIAWLPWAVIAVGVASLFVRARADSEDGSRANPAGLSIVLVLLLASLFALSRFGSTGGDLMPLLYGAAIGGVLGLLLVTVLGKFSITAVSSAGFAFGALSVAGAGAALASSMGDKSPYLYFGVGLGLAAASWAANGTTASHPLSSAAIGAILTATVDELGRRGVGNYGGQAGMAFALIAGICGVLSLGVLESDEKKRKLAPIVMAVLMTGAAWLVTTRLLQLNDAWIVFAAGAGAACVVHYLLPEDDQSAFGFMLATLIWLGLATLAFGMGKGFGMATATIGAAAVCLGARNGRALLSMGPLFGLVLYRVFREFFTDSSRALDIGQHYGLVGILVGAAVPVLAWEWWTTVKDRRDMGVSVASALWCVVIVGAPLLVAMLLSAKGYVGWVAGLGVSATILGLKGEKSSTPMALASGFAAFSALGFIAFRDSIDLTREEKVSSLAWSIGIFVVVALLIWFLSVRRNDAAVKEGQ